MPWCHLYSPNGFILLVLDNNFIQYINNDKNIIINININIYIYIYMNVYMFMYYP